MVWVACVVCGWCCVLVVFCMACSSHHFVHTKPPPLSPFPFPFTTPLFCLCLHAEKGVDQKVDGVEWSVVCGMQHISHCAFIKPSPTPVCLWSFTIPFSLSNSFSSSFLVWFGFVWTERVKDKCGTHHVKHTVHHIQSTPHSFHPITPPFSMSTWLIGL